MADEKKKKITDRPNLLRYESDRSIPRTLPSDKKQAELYERLPSAKYAEGDAMYENPKKWLRQKMLQRGATHSQAASFKPKEIVDAVKMQEKDPAAEAKAEAWLKSKTGYGEGEYSTDKDEFYRRHQGLPPSNLPPPPIKPKAAAAPAPEAPNPADKLRTDMRNRTQMSYPPLSSEPSAAANKIPEVPMLPGETMGQYTSRLMKLYGRPTVGTAAGLMETIRGASNDQRPRRLGQYVDRGD